MKVFSKEKFIEIMGVYNYHFHRGWVDECDGKTHMEITCMVEKGEKHDVVE